MWDEALMREMAYLLQDYEKRRGPVTPAPSLIRRRRFPTTKQRVRLFKRALIEAGWLKRTTNAEALRHSLPRACRRFAGKNGNLPGHLAVIRIRIR